MTIIELDTSSIDGMEQNSVIKFKVVSVSLHRGGLGLG